MITRHQNGSAIFALTSIPVSDAAIAYLVAVRAQEGSPPGIAVLTGTER